METSFRPLNADEMELLKKLLDHDFPGRDVLIRQLSSVTGRQIDENGSIELKTAENERGEYKAHLRRKEHVQISTVFPSPCCFMLKKASCTY
jgi:hypothetical protein